MAELSRSQILLVLIAAFFSALGLNFLPILSYPFRLFFTMIHELGHVLATILTGGQVVRFTIDRDGSGIMAHLAATSFCLIDPSS